MKYKLIALAISAFATSLSGTFYVQYISFIEPESFLGPNMVLLTVVCVIVGGLGTLCHSLAGKVRRLNYRSR